MMTYTIEEYRKRYHSDKSLRSVQRLVCSGRLPKGHNINKSGNYCIIEVLPESEEDKRRRVMYDIAEASVEYRKKLAKGKDPMEAAAEVVICYNISMTIFCEIHNIK